jgi:anti-sigma B factor antagonist
MPAASPSVTTTPAGNVTVVAVKGALKLGHAPLDELQQTLRRLADNGQVNVVVDLAEMPLFDSTGIGVLVLGFTSMRKRQGTLKICNVGDLPRKMLKTVGLINIFEVFSDREQAVGSFQQ